MANNRKVVIIGVLVAAAAVTVLAMSGVITPASNVQGTIGAAKRHQSEQIKAQDVSLTKVDIQRFLQSDLFRRIRSNPDLAKAIKAPGMPASDLYDKASRNPDFAKAMKDPNFVKAMKDPRFFKAVLDASNFSAPLDES